MENRIRAKHAKKGINEQVQPKATPLDILFQIYEKGNGFNYNRTSTSSAAFGAFRAYMRWSDDNSTYQYAKSGYRSALRDELEV